MAEEETSEVSRFNKDFEVLEKIGKGGYGYVFKVRNRLDGNAYAIKKIVLNSKGKAPNKKIPKEWELMSRLNHENVVRSLNCWIEVSDDIAMTDSESETLSAHGSNLLSNSAGGNPRSEESTTSLSEKDDDCGTSSKSMCHSSSDSDGIDFEDGEDNETEEQSQIEISSPPYETEESSMDLGLSPKRYLYIRMELCQKNTLRTVIDKEIYKNEKQLWSFFRQILDGLEHIHSQGMIHRDLKPENILVAYNFLPKISDFGLAEVLTEISSHSLLPESSQSLEGDTQDFLTGNVGTALYRGSNIQSGTITYMSPELRKASSGFYNQKVDMYSLGIIFFEMCIPCLKTGMERVQILGKLRQENIEMPDFFEADQHINKKSIIRWLLDHDPSKRPTAREVLDSEHLPPLEMEWARFQEMIRMTVSKVQLRRFKHLMKRIAKDDIHKKTVFESLTNLFEKHRAVRVSSPRLMPKNALSDFTESGASFRDSSGSLVVLPVDLRNPFARNVARNSISRLKRYSMKRVYRKREFTERALDIVTNTTATLLPDVEVMYMVSEIIKEFPTLEEKKVYFIQVNHTLLLTAILHHCRIPEEKRGEVIKILTDTKKRKADKVSHLFPFCSYSQIHSLFQLVVLECSLKALSAKLKPVTRGRGPNASMAMKALFELEGIVSLAEMFGVKQEIVVAPSLVHKDYSGFVFQFVPQLKKNKKYTKQDTLAAGGRYDNLEHSFDSEKKIVDSKVALVNLEEFLQKKLKRSSHESSLFWSVYPTRL